MRFDVFVHFVLPDADFQKSVLKQLEKIMTKLDDATVALDQANTALMAIGVEIDKVGVETQASLKQIADLIASGSGNTTPNFDAKLLALQSTLTSVASKIKVVDDLVP